MDVRMGMDVEGLKLASAMQEKEDQERTERRLVDVVYWSRLRVNGKGGKDGHGYGHGVTGEQIGPENEGLLALVQASLRKKFARLEEDRRMFEGKTEEVRSDYRAGSYGVGLYVHVQQIACLELQHPLPTLCFLVIFSLNLGWKTGLT